MSGAPRPVHAKTHARQRARVLCFSINKQGAGRVALTKAVSLPAPPVLRNPWALSGLSKPGQGSLFPPVLQEYLMLIYFIICSSFCSSHCLFQNLLLLIDA